MEFILLAGIVALIKSGVDLAKYLRNKEYGNTFTLLFVFAVGIAVVLLAGATDFANTFEVGGLVLSDLNVYSKIIVGLCLAANGSLAVETLKSIDNTRTSAKPKLFNEGES